MSRGRQTAKKKEKEEDNRSMIPKKFFVTSGNAVSPVSEVNAFDLALKNAGLAQCNLVSVSSILPPNCTETKRKELSIGSITFTVLARMGGDGRILIGAGIAWVWEKSRKYGLVAETHGHMDEEALKENLECKIREMARIRDIEIDEISYRLENLMVPIDNYGCVIVALVYV